MSNRSGIVLLLALLCMLALEFTAAALHFAALHQLRAAHAGSRGLQLRLGAETAITAAVARWPAANALATPVNGMLPIPGASGTVEPGAIAFSAAAERLSDELFLIRGHAGSPLGETARVGFLLLAGDPVAGLAAAALRSPGGVSLGAGGMLSVGDGSCPLAPLPAAVQLPDAADLGMDGGARLDGPVDSRPELRGAALQSMLPFQLPDLLATAADIPQAVAQPAPLESGARCATEHASNWGEPLPGSLVCGSWFPVLRRTGDLTLTGGRGQGILYVSGDLLLTGSAFFSGILLVEGSLTLRDGASVRGLVLAGSAFISGAALVGNRCAAVLAAAAAPAAFGPFAPAARRWVPVF